MIDRRALLAGIGATGAVVMMGMPAIAAPSDRSVLVFDDDVLADMARQYMAEDNVFIVEEVDLRKIDAVVSRYEAGDAAWIACTPGEGKLDRILRMCDESAIRHSNS